MPDSSAGMKWAPHRVFRIVWRTSADIVWHSPWAWAVKLVPPTVLVPVFSTLCDFARATPMTRFCGRKIKLFFWLASLPRCAAIGKVRRGMFDQTYVLIGIHLGSARPQVLPRVVHSAMPLG